MSLPFSREEFFGVFARYNEGVWPAQLGLYLVALMALVFAFRRSRDASRGVYAVLAILWLWMAVVYQAAFFFVINPLAAVFAVVFLIQAFIFAGLAARRTVSVIAPQNDFSGWAGGVLVVFGLVFYELLSLAKGHVYPSQPTFGLPCPTTIFTLGFMLWGWQRIPRFALVIPILWACIGTLAAFQLGVAEDLSLAGTLAIITFAGFMREPSSLASRSASYRKYGIT